MGGWRGRSVPGQSPVAGASRSAGVVRLVGTTGIMMRIFGGILLQMLREGRPSGARCTAVIGVR